VNSQIGYVNFSEPFLMDFSLVAKVDSFNLKEYFPAIVAEFKALEEML
jgi:hypothetical protein